MASEKCITKGKTQNSFTSFVVCGFGWLSPKKRNFDSQCEKEPLLELKHFALAIEDRAWETSRKLA